MYNRYYKFIKELEVGVKDLSHIYSNVIILCIGTKKVLGDSVGPLVGENIKYLEKEKIKIYGVLGHTINFNNAKNIITNIYKNFDFFTQFFIPLTKINCKFFTIRLYTFFQYFTIVFVYIFHFISFNFLKSSIF